MSRSFHLFTVLFHYRLSSCKRKTSGQSQNIDLPVHHPRESASKRHKSQAAAASSVSLHDRYTKWPFFFSNSPPSLQIFTTISLKCKVAFRKKKQSTFNCSCCITQAPKLIPYFQRTPLNGLFCIKLINISSAVVLFICDFPLCFFFLCFRWLNTPNISVLNEINKPGEIEFALRWCAAECRLVLFGALS